MTSTQPTVAGPHKVSARLADGREIIYFDETDDAPRVLTDPRDLPVVEPASEILRRDSEPLHRRRATGDRPAVRVAVHPLDVILG